MPKEKVRSILESEAQDRSFDPEIMKVFFDHFDQIVDTAIIQGQESLKPNAGVAARYEKLEKAMAKMKAK